MQRTLAQKLGLLGLISLASYTLAVLLTPTAYPGYQWMAQAVSDLSADTAPSRILWNQLSSLYMPCGLVCCTLCYLKTGQNTEKHVKRGIGLFALMNWVSAVGYAAFPLPASGRPQGFQGTMHLVITAAVVLLSIASLVLIFYGGCRKKACPFLGRWAMIALVCMMLGALGTNILPAAYFGIPERFSVFAATGFNAVLGLGLYRGLEVFSGHELV